jgi:hypothetical protein
MSFTAALLAFSTVAVMVEVFELSEGTEKGAAERFIFAAPLPTGAVPSKALELPSELLHAETKKHKKIHKMNEFLFS